MQGLQLFTLFLFTVLFHHKRLFFGLRIDSPIRSGYCEGVLGAAEWLNNLDSPAIGHGVLWHAVGAQV